MTQVRGSAQALIRYAKSSGAAVILVGHVTKDGQIAGPRVVEHMVDAVLSFEGDGSHHFRILRAVKNRFGPTDEIGVFEMTGAGLREVPNPSELFLSERDLGARHRCLRGHGGHAAGAGRDPGAGRAYHPRHAAPGGGRLGPAALHGARRAGGACGVRLGSHDVYLNVAGGLRIQEPAADLAAAAALVSSLTGHRCRPTRSFSANCRLSGAVRPVVQRGAAEGSREARLHAAVAPPVTRGEAGADSGLALNAIGSLTDLVADIAANGKRAKAAVQIARQDG